MPSAARTSSSRRSPAGSVGPYRLVREIGRGGMGSVWLAERSDDQFQKQVAVKLLSAGLPVSEALRRFRDERRILASLEHPHIARLLDAGRTDDGLHYIVMELVEGVPITEHCRARGARRSCARRAAADGRLRRPLRAPAPRGPSRPQAGEHPGGGRRPAAAPRLRHRQGAGPRFDYGDQRRCCTSRRRPTPAPSSCAACRRPPRATSTPWASSAASCLPAACPIQSKTDAEAPSTVARRIAANTSIGGQTAARLVGDLDAIVLKATRSQPEERYASAEELAADFGRYLDRRPVLARGGTLAYRVQRFVARHRAGAAAAAIALFAVLAGIGGVLWQASIARHERRVAEARFNDVRQLAGAMIFELYDGFAELPGSTAARQALVNKALQVLRRPRARQRQRSGARARAGLGVPAGGRRPVPFEHRQPWGYVRRARESREGAPRARRQAHRRPGRSGGATAAGADAFLDRLRAPVPPEGGAGPGERRAWTELDGSPCRERRRNGSARAGRGLPPDRGRGRPRGSGGFRGTSPSRAADVRGAGRRAARRRGCPALDGPGVENARQRAHRPEALRRSRTALPAGAGHRREARRGLTELGGRPARPVVRPEPTRDASDESRGLSRRPGVPGIARSPPARRSSMPTRTTRARRGVSRSRTYERRRRGSRSATSRRDSARRPAHLRSRMRSSPRTRTTRPAAPTAPRRGARSDTTSAGWGSAPPHPIERHTRRAPARRTSDPSTRMVRSSRPARRSTPIA